MARAFVKAATAYLRDVRAGRIKEPHAAERAAALRLLLESAIGYDNRKTNGWIVQELQSRGVQVSGIQDLQQNIWAPLRARGIFIAWGRGIYIPDSQEDYERGVLQYRRRIESERQHLEAAIEQWENAAP
jgi:hypothetical protein